MTPVTRDNHKAWQPWPATVTVTLGAARAPGERHTGARARAHARACGGEGGVGWLAGEGLVRAARCQAKADFTFDPAHLGHGQRCRRDPRQT